MALVSAQFLIFVIILLSVYYSIGKRFQWIFLLIASTVFYMSGDWHDVLYLGSTIVIQYVCTRLLDRENEAFEAEVREKQLKGKEKTACKNRYAQKKKKYLLLSVIITVGFLCYIKYTNFLIEIINSFFAGKGDGAALSTLDILIPLGVSFYTFQSVGYVIDVYKGRVRAEKNILKLALFISFFPTITQGPILRFEDVRDQLFRQHPFEYKPFVFGLERMIYGYLKKLIIAERLAVIGGTIVDNYAANHYSGALIFLGVFLKGLQVYMDFSGGMDIVIGLSESLGIRLPENFERPYLARTYGEFWRRWHITLGAWFMKYVFYPMSLSKAFNRLSKKSKSLIGDSKGRALAPCLASFITFFIIGIWHGAAWKYVAYGLWQAFFVAQKAMLQENYESLRNRLQIDTNSKAFIVFQIVRTILLVTIGRYFSFAATLTDAVRMLKITALNPGFGMLKPGVLVTLGLGSADLMIMVLFTALVFAVDLANERNISMREKLYNGSTAVRWLVLLAGIFAVLLLGIYGPGFDTSTFVYQRF